MWAQCFLSKGKSKCKGPVVGMSWVGLKTVIKTRMAGEGSRSGSLAYLRLDVTCPPGPRLPGRPHLLPFPGV